MLKDRVGDHRGGRGWMGAKLNSWTEKLAYVQSRPQSDLKTQILHVESMQGNQWPHTLKEV